MSDFFGGLILMLVFLYAVTHMTELVAFVDRLVAA